MDGFFITGTDTEIGKTFVACCVIETLKEFQDKPVHARKPIASGAIRFSEQKLISEDAMRLKKASDNNDSLADICPYLFEEPISPARAIKLNNSDIQLEDLIKASATPKKSIGIIEGAGGFYSPLVKDKLNKDLAIALKLPVIVVVGNRLGCINQALLTIQAIKDSKLSIAAVVVNNLSLDADLANYDDLVELLDEPCINLPYQPQQHPYPLESLWRHLTTD